MQIHENVTKKFMPTMPRTEPVVLDASAMMEYKTCPRKYFYRIVLGYDTKEPPPYFAWGAAYHIFREYLQLLIQQYTNEGKENAPILAMIPAMDKAVEYWKKYGKDQDKDSKFPHCTEGMLKIACEVAFKQVCLDIKSGRIKVIATEQAFTLKLPNGFLIGGRIDEVVKKLGTVFGRDFKTTSGKDQEYYSRSLEPNYQFTVYTWAERELTNLNVAGQLVEVLNVDKKKGPVIYELLTERTPGQIERWLLEQDYWFALIEKSRLEDMYPMNEKACWNCIYHSVCKKTSESGMLNQLRMNYKFRPWNFYDVRD